MRLLKRAVLSILLFIGIENHLNAGTIHGFVREKENREPVIMGNVWIRDTHIGTTTNMKGYYVLPDLSPGTYTIFFRYIGFSTVKKTVTLANNHEVTLDVLLEPEAILLEGTTVTAEREKRELEIMPGQIVMQAPELRSIPQVAESDLFRALQMLPGVATLSDFSAGLYVRGGSADQNLILLDEIDVYNPNHMFGFFSTFNTDAVKSVELLKGGYPARYGGRLSSVLNVFNEEGNREYFEGVAHLSLLSASSTLQGPWKYGSWMISGRRTYLDLAAKIADVDLPYYFYDGHAKINLDINKKNQASLSFYAGNDLLDLGEEGMNVNLDWGNKTFSAQWMHLFNSKLFSHFIMAGSRYASNTRVKFDKVEFGILNQITDLATKGILTYSPNTRHSVDFGFEFKSLKFDLDYKVVDTKYINNFSGVYFSGFMQDNIKITPLTIIQTGLRLDHYTDGNYTRLDPRFSIQQILNENMNIKLSYGMYHQFLNLVEQEGMSFASMWFPVDKTFEPGKSQHYIAGLHYDNKTTFSIDIEAYYKYYDNIAEYDLYRNEDELIEDQTASSQFLSGIGKAYGTDVYIRNRLGKLEGWLGYSLCWTKKQVNGYNFSKWYFPTYDRRHTITLIQDYHLNKHWRINAAFKYGSGQPYTEATAWYEAMDQAGRIHYETLEGEKNVYRLPDYHRLDIGLFYTQKVVGKKTEFFVQVVNVYNRKNILFRTYSMIENPPTVQDISMLPIIPTLGVSVYF
ncbi:TonB-dependent receptor [bacterium]|nr:TonB-dependent receptor [bacterium]